MRWTRTKLWFTRLLVARREDGGNMVEYMLLLTLIAILMIVVVTGVGIRVSTRFSSAVSQIP